MQRLARARVAVFGLGGVGSYVVEALARGGVGALDLVDSDCVDLTNLNRQLLATHETLGQAKVDVAAQRVQAINPACQVTTYQCFYLPETAAQFPFDAYDYVVDAVDTTTAKISLVLRAQEAGVPVISCMGTGNKLDPTVLRVADLFATQNDGLARIMRKQLRKAGITQLKVVYSPEEPAQPRGEVPPVPEGSSRHVVPGSTSFVPGVAGLIIAGEVLKDLTAVE